MASRRLSSGVSRRRTHGSSSLSSTRPSNPSNELGQSTRKDSTHQKMRIVGCLLAEPVGQGEPRVLPMAHPWLLPLVTMLSGLLSGLLVFNLAPMLGST